MYLFLRTKFICIIWTMRYNPAKCSGSWGLSLFVLFELTTNNENYFASSWGLSLFVLFEPIKLKDNNVVCSWGLSLFVLFELPDWQSQPSIRFLRTKFICIIWTDPEDCRVWACSWGLSLFVLFEPVSTCFFLFTGSWGLSLFVLFERLILNRLH